MGDVLDRRKSQLALSHGKWYTKRVEKIDD